MTDTNHGILGIDISKAKFDVALMVEGKIKKKHILGQDFSIKQN